MPFKCECGEDVGYVPKAVHFCTCGILVHDDTEQSQRDLSTVARYLYGAWWKPEKLGVISDIISVDGDDKP
jgi:hypothetical protein